MVSDLTKKPRRAPRKARTRTGARKRPRPPPSKSTKPRRPSHVAFIGNPAVVVALRAELDDLGIASLIKDSPATLIAGVNRATQAVVISPPVPDRSVAEICASLSEEHPQLPVFTVVRSNLPWRAEKQLYDAGSLAVFVWPKEKRALIQTLIELTRVPRRVTEKEPTDAALAKMARSRIKAAAELRDCKLHVRVVLGVAVLNGTVPSLWQVEAAAMILRDIPGVQRVAAHEVHVDAEGRSDRVIEATVRSVIESVSGLDLGTLALQVTDGQVVLVGTVGSSSELDRVRALIRELRGVRSLKTFVTVSSDARIRDQALVKKIRKSLALRYPKHRISVSAFGNVAVLRGTVPLAKTREDIAKLVAIEPGVERVVNKLVVRRSSKGRNEP